MENRTNKYIPDTVSPPGETLFDVIEEIGMSQKELADRMGRPEKTINEIIKGKTIITSDTAIQLERVLNIPAHFWMQREANYQEYLAALREETALVNSLDWLKSFPISQMIKLGWISREKDSLSQLKEVLNYFGVASVDAWNTLWLQEEAKTSFRISSAFQSEHGAIAAWLRHGELRSIEKHIPAFNEKILKENLQEIRALSMSTHLPFKEKLKGLCNDAGVNLVFSPMVSKAPIAGAVRWFGDRPIIQLSLRGKNNDIFWFTFFHEVGHILLHGKKEIFVESEDNKTLNQEKESEADEFSLNFLIPRNEFKEFISNEDFSPTTVLRFAKKIGIHSGIVVGCLQKRGIISYSYLSELKKRINIDMD